MNSPTNWFSVHAIFYFELLDEPQSSYLVHENVYLVNAIDGDAAEEIGAQVALDAQDLSEDGHLELNEKKVRYVYAGIRKVIEVEPREEGNEFTAQPQAVEVTYSVYEVDSLEQVQSLARGEMIEVMYRE
jgi:hypothetical protein